MGWLKKIGLSKNKETYQNNFNDLDIDSLFTSLRSNAIKIKKQEKILENIYPLEEPLKEYLSLDRSVKNNLTILAGRYKDSTDEKNKLNTRLIKNNPALSKMEAYESEIPVLQNELKEVSTLASKYKTNIEYLRIEKDNLVIDREALLVGYEALEKIGMFFLTLLGLSLIITFTLMQIIRESVWVYMSMISIAFMGFVLFLIFSKERLERELVRNEILQKKAAKYIQKFQIHYFTQQQYLDYQYKKLGINNVEQLDNYFTKYLKNKGHERNYQQHVQTLQVSEQKIKDTLRINEVPIRYINTIEEWVLNPYKLEEAKNMVSEMDSIKTQITKMKEYEQELYATLMNYGTQEEYEDTIKDKMGEFYKWINEELDQEASV
ncbi:hypothetical protein [Candidatus Epulonipiscium viviparus]|uniref:hypothetical protein n=1 Tax=Candidatus Epulonipiscium viviparus TaxID=420336 RepID=UPI00016C0B55|nr:hypothetical protein [Candidatus Epulopiscium viviparus]